jgi:dTDP-4-amino-4,6-dideoxygalactose transaminase
LRSGWLGTSPKVTKFEEMVRDYVGAEYAMALNSCTAGLHLSMLVAGLEPGDEVITTPMTFCATVNTIIHAGATPMLVECDRDTMLIDPQRIEDAITPRTKAIVPVHLCRRSCNLGAAQPTLIYQPHASSLSNLGDKVQWRAKYEGVVWKAFRQDRQAETFFIRP